MKYFILDWNVSGFMLQSKDQFSPNFEGGKPLTDFK